MHHLVGFCIRRPFLTLAILAVISIVLAPGILKLKIDNSIETIMPKSDAEYIFYNNVKKIYGDNGQILIMAVSADDLWSHHTLASLNNLIVDLEEYKKYHKKRESERIERFAALLSRESMTSGEIVAAFDGDPPFQRAIERILSNLYDGRETLSRRNLKKIHRQLVASAELKRLELVDEIISPFTAKDIRGEADTLEVYDLVPKDESGNRTVPETVEEITRFRMNMQRNPAFERVLYTRDPANSLITDFGIIVKFNDAEERDPVTRDLLTIIHSYRNLHITYSGLPAVYVRAVDYIRLDFSLLVPLIIFVVMLVFYFNFRSLRGVILPSLTLFLTELWTMGLMGYLGYKITVIASSIPTLLIAVGSSYSIHIMNQYYIDFDTITERGKRDGLYAAMTHITLTVLLAGFTTFIAFVSLCTNEISQIREWGIFCGIGAMFAVAVSCTLIPACCMILPHSKPASLIKKKTDRGRPTLIERFIYWATNTVTIRHRTVIAVVLVMVILSVAGLMQLEVDTIYLNFFKKESDIRQGVNVIGEKFGGGWGFDILIDSGDEDGVKSPEYLNALEKFRTWLIAEENIDLRIGRTDAFPDLIKTMHMAMNNDEYSWYRIPDNQTDIADYLEIYAGDDEDSDGRFDEFKPFVDGDYQTCDILARLCRKEGQLVGTADVNRIVAKMSDYLKTHLPDTYSFHITGFPIMETTVARYIVRGQIQNLSLTFVIVGIVVLLLFQRLAAGLLALIPISAAVLVSFGVMGWSGIVLDMTTSVIAAVTIGIGIDDTIHFLNTYRHQRAQGHSIDEAVRYTQLVAGKAIIFTSLALIFGFLVFTLSQFIPIILLGILLPITMIATTLGAIMVLPACIKYTRANLNPPEKATWLTRYLNLGRWFGLDEEK